MTKSYVDHPKVKQAQALLREAALELKHEENVKRGQDKCTCGHERSKHGPSYSIHYTEGVCHECDCLNFMMPIYPSNA